MVMAIWQATIVDGAGNVLPGAHIEVRTEAAGGALAPLKPNRDGSGTLGNPFDADAEGFAQFFASAGFYKIRVYTGASGAPTFERIWRYVPLGLAAGSDNTNYPITDDGAPLGSGSLRWSDLFLALGGIINWDNGDVTITHSSDGLAFAGAANGYTFSAAIKPAANDGGALGSSALKWSDLFLASGAVIDFNSGDVTITHSSNEIAVAGGRLRLGSVAADTFGGTFQTDALEICNTSASFLLKATSGAANNRMMDIAHGPSNIFEGRFLDDTFSTGGSIFQVTRSGNSISQISLFGGAAVEQFRLTASHAYFPAVGTTASAANAFLNSGSSPVNELLRSTSSLAYKRDVEPLQEEYANKVLDLQPIWYRSKASNDNPDWSWYGLGAEDVAKVDPRLVQWGYQDDDFDLVETVRVETIEREVEMDVDGKTVVETVPHEIKTVSQERVLKEGAQLKPDGVMYDRVAVLLLDVVKRQGKRIAALEARL
ncbi:MAG: hypothetical protein OJF48_001921 [Afipia sp.]|jgi:hypothetical protein|nr:MAG: hypothetical protein OJF48_001921 [Afipia sp.]